MFTTFLIIALQTTPSTTLNSVTEILIFYFNSLYISFNIVKKVKILEKNDILNR